MVPARWRERLGTRALAERDCGSLLFFFSSRRRHTRCLSDWSSDVALRSLAFGRRIPQCLAAPSTFFFLRLQRMKLLPPEFARGKRGWFPWVRSAHGHANRVRKSCRAK